MSEKVIHRVLALVIFLVPLVVYLLTMAPTLVLWDSGEFIATAVTLGIPHSPGTPLFTLVGRVFAMLSLPMNAAARVNFFSVLSGSLAVLMGYLIAVKTIRFMYPSLKGGLARFMTYAGPFVGALYITFSHTHWLDSTETEVYALNTFVMGLCTWLALEWYQNPGGHVLARKAAKKEGKEARAEIERAMGDEERSERGHARGLVYLIIYVLALGIGFHLGTVLVYGGILFLFLLVREKAFTNAEIIIYTFGFAVILADITLIKSSGVTIVGLVIFAAAVAWSTQARGRFALVATGLLALGISVHVYMYIRAHLHPTINMVDPETWEAMRYHLRREQYPPTSIFVRRAPLAWQFKNFAVYFREQFRMLGDVKLGVFNLGQALTAIPVALGLFGIAANFGRERKLWVLNFTNLLVSSLGLIIFLNFTANEVRDRDYFYCGAFYFFAIFISIGVTSLLVSVAEFFKGKGKEPAAYVVPIGVLCVALSILPAHHNWLTHDRSRYYFAQDYARNMLASLEPDAIIFTGGDNDTYPLWFVQNVEHYRTDVRVIVLTLLNTTWYVKQLRDEAPNVPITLVDAEIESLRPIALKGGGVAYNDDLMVQHIIRATDWKRPIYFATSVAPAKWIPYEQNLETRGLVMRLVPYQGRSMRNAFLMRRSFGELFTFRGFLTADWQVDTALYKEKDLNIIMNNYSAGMYDLAREEWKEQNYVNAARWTERSLSLNPKFKPAQIMLGVFYALSNERQKAIDYYSNLVREEPSEGEYWLRRAWVYSLQGNFPAALQSIDEGIRNAAENGQFYIDGYRYAAGMGNTDVAKSYLQQWLEKHPDDQEFRKAAGDIERMLQQAPSPSPGNRSTGGKPGR
jgi:tetratricopeptide (TPR) repeat protein